MDTNGKPTVISTFCGTGGSSLGYHRAGFKELLAVDWDEDAVRCFKANFMKAIALCIKEKILCH